VPELRTANRALYSNDGKSVRLLIDDVRRASCANRKNRSSRIVFQRSRDRPIAHNHGRRGFVTSQPMARPPKDRGGRRTSSQTAWRFAESTCGDESGNVKSL